MNALVTDLNLAAPDDFYEALIALHRGLSDEQSALVNAKLVLLLANHVGDPQVLREAMAAAREDVVAGEALPGSASGAAAAPAGADPSRSGR